MLLSRCYQPSINVRIAIIGLPGCGKTTLARLLSAEYSIDCLDLDTIVFRHLSNRKRERLPSSTYIAQIIKFARKKQWIIEGIYPIDAVFQQADIIVWLKMPLLRTLWGQWKRYIKDPQQRQGYGFISNLKLSFFIFNLFLDRQAITVMDDRPKIRLKDFPTVMKPYRKKIRILTTNKQLASFLSHLSHGRRAFGMV